jgi:CRISPR-associated endonuclease Csn1
LNDTRYITKQVLFYLTQIVPKEQVRVSLGEITNELKNKWGLNETMKRILIPRFERLQEISGEALIEFQTTPEGQRKVHLEGYEKRIDHRHHALDALIVACTTNRHVQYLSTLKAASDPSVYFKFKKLLNSPKTRDFRLPWPGFIPDTIKALNQIIVSHKNRNRILSKGVNRYVKFVRENGEWVKKSVFQETSDLYSIRQPLHKETIHGMVRLRKYKNVALSEAIKKVDFIADKRVKTSLKQIIQETAGNSRLIKQALQSHPLVDKAGNQVTNRFTIWYFETFSVSREKLDVSFTEEKIRKKVAEYDTRKEKGMKHLLISHLRDFDNDPKKAFVGEGLETLWKRAGQPITTISTYETLGKKFPIRPNQLVEAAKGTNLFFVVYENLTTGDREFETLRLDEVIAAKIQKLPIVKPREGFRHFTLSPNDLVYVPEENENIRLIDWENERERISRRIYKVVSSTGPVCYFVPHKSAKVVLDKVEYGSLNKSERDVEGKMIKHHCIKLRHDRLGNVTPFPL